MLCRLAPHVNDHTEHCQKIRKQNSEKNFFGKQVLLACKMYSVVWFCHGLIVLSYSVARCLRRQTRIQCISNCNVQISKEA